MGCCFKKTEDQTNPNKYISNRNRQSSNLSEDTYQEQKNKDKKQTESNQNNRERKQSSENPLLYEEGNKIIIGGNQRNDQKLAQQRKNSNKNLNHNQATYQQQQPPANTGQTIFKSSPYLCSKCEKETKLAAKSNNKDKLCKNC